jgi:hypothetical protein
MADALTLLNVALAADVTAAVTTPQPVHGSPRELALYANFVRAGGGTTAVARVQTTFDNAATWVDIANFAFTTSSAVRVYNLTNVAVTSIATPTDGTLADNTAVNGLLGTQFRVKYTTVGTYTGASSFTITAIPK